VVIDNGDDFRMDPKVPLVIPEINPDALKGHQGLIANPNCSTIIALMPLAALHRAARIKRIVASTYQAVSGTGSAAVKELEAGQGLGGGQPLPREVYPHQIAFNVIPQVGSFKDDSGESTEEIKMRKETHKILGDSSIRIGNTCVRVPVINGHSIAINVEFEKPLSARAGARVAAPGPGRPGGGRSQARRSTRCRCRPPVITMCAGRPHPQGPERRQRAGAVVRGRQHLEGRGPERDPDRGSADPQPGHTEGGLL
jgi:aspartate-semialdehyde dehydrogenase